MWARTLVLCLSAAAILGRALSDRPQFSPNSRSYTEEDEVTSKWIVVTTVNYPTETIQTLAAVPAWRVVVVADLNTPADWDLLGVDFLSVEKQKTLGYSILPLLPNNHYGRKNLGYLYAIQNGATLVYETDDDNVLKVSQPATMEAMEFYTYNQTDGGVCNPYQFFGLPHIWPRGYPLDQIHAPECDTFIRRPVRPLVLQGMADLDPDVDAIYRLTQKLGVNFQKDNIASVALPEGVFCPWNSQNTLFEHDALWGLLIPVTTTFRVCDIWRSYWVQRLLWEVGGNLAFGPPTVDQFRNVHTLLRDFNDELDLYNLTGHLIELLNQWQPPAGADLPTMMVDLGQRLADAKMWAQGDADLMAAWTADLRAVGYAFPPVRGQKGAAAPAEPAVQLPRTPRAWQRYRDIVLVVVFNKEYPDWQVSYRTVVEAYRPLFSRLIITGSNKRPADLPADQEFVACHGDSGKVQYACFASVMQEVSAPKNGGYLILGDDTLIDHCQMRHFNASKVWYQRAVKPKQENLIQLIDTGNLRYHWHFDRNDTLKMHNIMRGFQRGSSMNRFAQRVTEHFGDDFESAHFGGDFTDALYIPQRLATDFAAAALPFNRHEIFHEVAVPAILGIITDSDDDFEVFKPLYLWALREDAMANTSKVLRHNGLANDVFVLHPYKFTYPDAPGRFWAWWEGRACSSQSALPKDWQGTQGLFLHNLNEDYDYKDILPPI